MGILSILAHMMVCLDHSFTCSFSLTKLSYLNTGVYLSNSYNLLVNSTKSFKGLLIEANEDRFKKLQSLYNGRGDVITLNQLVSFQGIDITYFFVHSLNHPLFYKETVH